MVSLHRKKNLSTSSYIAVIFFFFFSQCNNAFSAHRFLKSSNFLQTSNPSLNWTTWTQAILNNISESSTECLHHKRCTKVCSPTLYRYTWCDIILTFRGLKPCPVFFILAYTCDFLFRHKAKYFPGNIWSMVPCACPEAAAHDNNDFSYFQYSMNAFPHIISLQESDARFK